MVSLGGRSFERRTRGFESRHERLKSSFEAFFFVNLKEYIKIHYK